MAKLINITDKQKSNGTVTVAPGTDLNIKKAKQVRKPRNTSKFAVVENFLTGRYELRYNEVANEVECLPKGESEFRALNENNLYRELQLNHIPFSLNNLTALLRSDYVYSYNPFIAYFKTLPGWDGTTDHIQHLCSYVKVTEQERFNLHLRKMLIRSIACSVGGVFNRHCLVLIGGQGTGKTTFTRWLVPLALQAYYTEAFSTDKDSLIALSENFFIVLDELATLHRAELTALKSFFTKEVIKVRRPYDRKPMVVPRRANFIGTTNRQEFLTDETGNTRWLPFVLIEKINFAYKQDCNIDMIWAQAWKLYKDGTDYQLTADEIKENEAANAEHHSLTTEMELIQKHFTPAAKDEPSAENLTATEILSRLQSAYPALLRQSNRTIIGRALTFLGFEAVSVRDAEKDKAPRKKYPIKKKEPLSVNMPNPPTTFYYND